MSEKTRRKKDGQEKNKEMQEGRKAVAERQEHLAPQQMPKDKSNHLIGDDEQPEPVRGQGAKS
ncbi:MAG: hypothetical protein ACR2GW_10980 [Pyrinomonadaceae bacterium]|nr:hypothetical protein [Acidobacteriota bacterium]